MFFFIAADVSPRTQDLLAANVGRTDDVDEEEDDNLAADTISNEEFYKYRASYDPGKHIKYLIIYIKLIQPSNFF